MVHLLQSNLPLSLEQGREWSILSPTLSMLYGCSLLLSNQHLLATNHLTSTTTSMTLNNAALNLHLSQQQQQIETVIEMYL
jgi:hypothetical protein